MADVENNDRLAKEDHKEEKKKIIGEKGYRPPIATPLTLPFNIELLHEGYRPALYIGHEGKNKGIFLGDSKYAKITHKNGQIRGIGQHNVSFAQHDKHGLVFSENTNIKAKKNKWKILHIPGELGFTKTVELLARNPIFFKPISNYFTELEKTKKSSNLESLGSSLDYLKFRQEIQQTLDDASVRNRKREIAAALLTSGLWKNRGKFDPEKIAPRNFWRVVPAEDLCVSNRKNLQSWWENSVIKSVRLIPNLEKYGIEPAYYKYHFFDNYFQKHKEDFEKDCNKAENNFKKAYQMRGFKEYAILIKPVRKKITEGFLPKYPWEVRHWDKVPFELLKKATIFGLHKLPEWDLYAKAGAPELYGIILCLELNHIETKNKEKAYPFEELPPKIKQKIQETINLFTQNKIYEGQHFLTKENESSESSFSKRIWNPDDFNRKPEELLDIEEEKKSNNLTIAYKERQKKQFIEPNFACMDGWKWNNSGESLMQQEYFIAQDNYSGIYEPFPDKKCIAIRDDKEVLLEYQDTEKYGMQWVATLYKKCDLDDLRKIKTLERVLQSLHTGLDIKNIDKNDTSEQENTHKKPLILKPTVEVIAISRAQQR